LKQLPQRDVKAFLIWEPVMSTDTEGPSAETLARASDPRVRHFWDPQLRLASYWQPILKAERSPTLGKQTLVTGKVLWDFVAVYPPGVQWEAQIPAPTFKAAPVTAHQAQLLTHLETR